MVTPTKELCGCSNWTGVRVVVGGILIHLSLGTLFTFGNMSPYMTSYMRKYGSAPSLTYTECAWVYATASMGQGSAIMIGGMIERLIGTKLTPILGGWFMSAGVAATFFSVKHSFALTAVTYGAVFGLGCGTAYGVPLGCAMRWFPKWKGLVNGLVVAGFGGGAFIFNQVQTAFINPDNLKPDIEVDGDKYFSQDIILDRVPWTFILLGGCYAVMQLIGSLLLSNPPYSEPNVSISIVEEQNHQTTSFEEEDTETPNQQFPEPDQHVIRSVQQLHEGLNSGHTLVVEVSTTTAMETPASVLQFHEGLNSGHPSDVEVSTTTARETTESGHQLDEGLNSGHSSVVEGSTTTAIEASQSVHQLDAGLNSGHPTDVEVSATTAVETTESVHKLNEVLNSGHPLNVEVSTTTSMETPDNSPVEESPVKSEAPTRRSELKGGKSQMEDDFTLKPLEVLRSRYFYCMWLMFVFNGQGIIFISTLYKAYGQTFISDDAFMALAGAFGSVFNAVGRIFWGVMADKFSFRVASLIMSAAFTCLMLTLQLCERGGKPLFFVYVCLLFGSFSGSYALFPTATAKCFGRKYLPINYGLVFTSQVITAPLGVFLSQSLKSSLGWEGLFFLVAGCSCISFILSFLFNARDKQGNEI